jgi:hypothetical protein
MKNTQLERSPSKSPEKKEKEQESEPDPDSPSECVLDNPDLDIIPEAHHLTGQCLCHLCTCKKHVCKYPRPSTVKGSFKTHYQRNFKIQPIEPQPPKKVTYVYHPRNLCFYGESSQKKDYRPHSLTPTPKQENVRSVTPTYKFIGNTHYQSQYPDWGPVAHDIYEKPQPSHYTNLRFNGISSYSDSYKPVSSSFNYKHGRAISSRESQSRASVLNKSAYDIPETTNNKYFKQYSGNNYNSLVQRRAYDYVPTCFSPAQYKSSNQRTYVHQEASLIDPRKLKWINKKSP